MTFKEFWLVKECCVPDLIACDSSAGIMNDRVESIEHVIEYSAYLKEKERADKLQEEITNSNKFAQDQENKIADLAAELKRVKIKAVDERFDLESRLKIARAALEFYANRINWNHAAFNGVSESCIRHADLEPAVPEATKTFGTGTAIRCFEGGKLARQTLAAIDKGDSK